MYIYFYIYKVIYIYKVSDCTTCTVATVVKYYNELLIINFIRVIKKSSQRTSTSCIYLFCRVVPATDLMVRFPSPSSVTFFKKKVFRSVRRVNYA